MKRTTAWLSFITLVFACSEVDSRTAERVHAAGALTQRYAQSRLARWEVRGRAAGRDCRMLFIVTAIVMDDSMVEALHSGAGVYDVYRGGIRQFAHDRAFRGVVYKDGTGRLWTFGSVNAAETLVPCR